MKIPIISNRLKNIFKNLNINSIVVYDNINYLDIDEKNNNYITYSTNNNISNEDVWKKSRNNIRFGRFLKKYFILENNQIENLVNQFKTCHTVEIGNIDDLFDIVKGDKIHHYYKEKNNINGGSLSNSCMKNAPKNKLKLYTNNPQKIRLLILKDKNSDKIKARALLWKTRNGYYIDRPYCCDDKYLFLFKIYSVKNNYNYYYDNKDILYIDNIIVGGDLPYLDTFKISNEENTKQSFFKKLFNKINKKITLVNKNSQDYDMYDIVQV